MISPRIEMWRFGALLGLMTCVASVAGAEAPPVLEVETSDTATLPPIGAHWFFTESFNKGTVIFDGDSGKLEGQIPGSFSSLAIAPDRSQIYIAETMYTHGNRGDRLDLLSIYDSRTLNLVKEIPLPGRALAGMKKQNFDVTATGKRAYIYNMHPASSVIWVDLARQAIGGVVEIPGCALVFPWGEEEFSSLCGDGSLANVFAPAQGPAKVSHTKPFFDANKDPIFENSLVDRVTGKALFISYTGLVYPAQLGDNPTVEHPWSIQQAAGQPLASTGVAELAWRPGGFQFAAWHKASERLFILMHPGDYWSQKTGGTEVWVLNIKSHSLVARFYLSGSAPIMSIAVSQDANPLLYLIKSEGNDIVLDANTGEELRKIEAAAGNGATVAGF